MTKLFILLSILSSLLVAQDSKTACPITKKEAYILSKTFDEKKCSLTPKEDEYILMLREKELVDQKYEYIRRLNFEVGIFDEV